MASVILNVTGMTCAVCVGAVQKSVSKLDGVQSANVNLTTGKLKVVYNDKLLDVEAIKQAVISSGYGIANNAKFNFETSKTMDCFFSNAEIKTFFKNCPNFILPLRVSYPSMAFLANNNLSMHP